MTYLNPENFSMSSLKKKNEFYVNIPKMKYNDSKTAAINQIIRYTDRPVMTTLLRSFTMITKTTQPKSVLNHSIQILYDVHTVQLWITSTIWYYHQEKITVKAVPSKQYLSMTTYTKSFISFQKVLDLYHESEEAT